MDELFEILTLVQTNKIERVPIILFGSYFWNPLKDFLLKYLGKNSKIDESDLDLFIITDSIDTAMQVIKAAPIREAN
jgi:predicted Rossmann-fold nucleotide-binding protein